MSMKRTMKMVDVQSPLGHSGEVSLPFIPSFGSYDHYTQRRDSREPRTMSGLYSSNRSPSPESGEELSTELKNYFAKRAEISDLKDAIAILEISRREGAKRRQRLEDQERPLESSPAEFELYYARNRAELQSKVDEASHELARLEKDCSDKGLDLESKKSRRRSRARPNRASDIEANQHASTPSDSGAAVSNFSSALKANLSGYAKLYTDKSSVQLPSSCDGSAEKGCSQPLTTPWQWGAQQYHWPGAQNSTSGLADRTSATGNSSPNLPRGWQVDTPHAHRYLYSAGNDVSGYEHWNRVPRRDSQFSSSARFEPTPVQREHVRLEGQASHDTAMGDSVGNGYTSVGSALAPASMRSFQGQSPSSEPFKTSTPVHIWNHQLYPLWNTNMINPQSSEHQNLALQNAVSTSRQDHHVQRSSALRQGPATHEPGGKEYTDFLSTFRTRPKSRKFFVVGKVFLVLWAEPAGESPSSTPVVTALQQGIRGHYGEPILSKVRRFVVVREAQHYCSAIPIVTYGQQGVAKAGVKKSDHAIIYTGKVPPPLLSSERPRRHESGPQPTPIRVDPDSPEERLDPVSRIDFGKVHTIHHNIKVRSFGKVNRDSMGALMGQFRNVWSPVMESERSSVTNDSSTEKSAATPASLGSPAQSGGKAPKQDSAKEYAGHHRSKSLPLPNGKTPESVKDVDTKHSQVPS